MTHTHTSDYIETNALHVTAHGSEGTDEQFEKKIVQRYRKLSI